MEEQSKKEQNPSSLFQRLLHGGQGHLHHEEDKNTPDLAHK